MKDDLEKKLAALRDEFLETMVERMGGIRADLEELEGGNEDAAADLISLVHKLSGGGGTFGFAQVSHLAGDMEILLCDGNRDTARLGRLAGGLQTLLDAGGNLDAGAEARLLDDLSGDLVSDSGVGQ